MEYSTIISSISALIIIVAAVLSGLYFTGFFTPNIDCVVSDWSTCDPATSLQTRTVTTAASGKGQACPPLTQSCTPNVDCVVSGWSTCDPTSKTKSRTITTPSSGSGKACPTVLQSDCIPDGNYFLVSDYGGINGNYVCSETLDGNGQILCNGSNVDVISISNTSDGNLALKGTQGYYGISGNKFVNNLSTLQPFNIKYTDKTQGIFNLFDGNNKIGYSSGVGPANTADLTNADNQWFVRKAS